jgi:Ser/Thr protein kinase RdoA (MazF antagonist)
VYEVDAGGGRFVVKASAMHDALRAEAWACSRGADAGCAAPAVLAFGRLRSDPDASAFIMSRVAGGPIAAGSAAFREAGVRLRRLHDAKLTGFGWLAGASRDERGDLAPVHGSWLGFLKGILADARGLAHAYAVAAEVAEAAAAAVDEHAGALAAVEVGSLCHGDLKAAHVLTDEDRITGVIDWGDAVAGDPLWDVARLAHRADAGSVSLLLEGYEPDSPMRDAIGWRVPLYGALWMLVDAIAAHRLGRRAEFALEAARAQLPHRVRSAPPLS